MDRNRYNTSRTRLLLIGAGASALALIALSGSCWIASIWMDITSGEEAGFWEILGVSSAGFVGLLLLHPLRKRLRERDSNAGITSPVDPPPEPFSNRLDGAVNPCEPRSRWRAMYEELSREDQELFKKLMMKVCNDTPAPDDSIADNHLRQTR